jgi:WD40 repeat protein
MSEPVLSVASSPNGQHVASSSANGEVVIWNLASGQKRAALRPKTERGFDKAVRAVAFSPDGGKLAVARGTDIELWDLAQLPEQ